MIIFTVSHSKEDGMIGANEQLVLNGKLLTVERFQENEIGTLHGVKDCRSNKDEGFVVLLCDGKPVSDAFHEITHVHVFKGGALFLGSLDGDGHQILVYGKTWLTFKDTTVFELCVLDNKPLYTIFEEGEGQLRHENDVVHSEFQYVEGLSIVDGTWCYYFSNPDGEFVRHGNRTVGGPFLQFRPFSIRNGTWFYCGWLMEGGSRVVLGERVLYEGSMILQRYSFEYGDDPVFLMKNHALVESGHGFTLYHGSTEIASFQGWMQAFVRFEQGQVGVQLHKGEWTKESGYETKEERTYTFKK